jgi:GT2 family glycosyltransferase
MYPLISIVYVNYNTSSLLLNSIESVIERCTSVSKEFIVVDNASNPLEKDILEKWKAEQEEVKIHLIFSDENLGFAGGNNLGASKASGEHVFFLNPDTLVMNDVLRIFKDFMERMGDGVSAIGGNLLEADLKPNYCYGNFPGIALELCNVGLGLSPVLGNYYKNKLAIGCKVQGKEILEVPYVIGAALFMRLATFKRAHGFDDQYFMYYEETDLFRRFQEMGLKAYILPDAEIIHFEGAAIGKSDAANFNYQKFEVALKSKFYYYKKWKGSSLSLIKGIVLLQIIVQYLKGKWGNNLKRLLVIYNQSLA